MTEYKVVVVRYASTIATVEAETVGVACELAASVSPGTLCHHCSGDIDLGDIDGCVVYSGDDVVYDDTSDAHLRAQHDGVRLRFDRLRNAVTSVINDLNEHVPDGCAGPDGNAREGACFQCRIAEYLTKVLGETA